MNCPRLLSFFTFLFALGSLQAQTITGKVIDAKNGEPLPFANVFINNTTLGTTTELNGEFTLRNVRQPAVYEVIFSFVGYETIKMNVSLTENEVKLGTIKLKPSDIELTTVEVKGSKDTQWEKKIKRFKRIFLGDDKAAELCEITNAWVIDFPKEESGNKFRAVAGAPLEIDNKALGYKLNFHLRNFLADASGYLIEGNVRFEEKASTDEKEKSDWASNRKKSYDHSRYHLFKAILDNRIQGEGFGLYAEMPNYGATNVRSPIFSSEVGKSVKPYDTLKMVTATQQRGVYRISLNGRVEVHYRKEHVPVRTYRDVSGPVSWISLKHGYVLVNADGVELNPADVIVSGAMSEDRVSHMLPLNYLPDETVAEEKQEELVSLLEEKIYVHTDKPYYYPGETVWFKGYINYRSPALRDSLSQTVYVELIDRIRSRIAMSEILPIDGGFFYGQFSLPDSMKTRTYYLRAYTNLNRNFGDENLYVKTLPVLSLTEMVDPRQKRIALSADSSFTVQSDKAAYHPREKITLYLRLKDEDSQPLTSHLSLSVTDATQVVPLENFGTILEGYPLKAPLPFQGKKGLLFPIEYGVSFTGRFRNNSNIPEKTLLNVLQLNPRNFVLVQSDENGIFSVSGLNFYESASFSIQAVGEKGKTYGNAVLVPRDIPGMNFKLPDNPLRILPAPTVQRINSSNELPAQSKLLNEVVVQTTKPEDIRKRRPYGKPDYVLKSKDFNTAYGNLLLALPGKFPGLVIRQIPGGNWVVYVQRAATASINNPKEVLVMVNDVAAGGTPADILGSINPANVETVELKSGINVMYGSLSGSGVLSVYTKSGLLTDDDSQPVKNLTVVKIEGYSKPREFPSTDYSDSKRDASANDFRSLIYWNPRVETKVQDGMASVSFYAADLPGFYQATVEGITPGGKPIRHVHFIEVESK